jgi:hypothetical protein
VIDKNAKIETKHKQQQGYQTAYVECDLIARAMTSKTAIKDPMLNKSKKTTLL